MSTTTERRHVRVTLEGTLHKLNQSDTMVMLTRPDGAKTCLPQSGPGITIEDVEPPRVWTDGDVVQASLGLSWVRIGGWWTPVNGGNSRRVDAEIEAWCKLTGSAASKVMRYQAGDQ